MIFSDSGERAVNTHHDASSAERHKQEVHATKSLLRRAKLVKAVLIVWVAYLAVQKISFAVSVNTTDRVPAK